MSDEMSVEQRLERVLIRKGVISAKDLKPDPVIFSMDPIAAAEEKAEAESLGVDYENDDDYDRALYTAQQQAGEWDKRFGSEAAEKDRAAIVTHRIRKQS